jgi:hypothetical protein
MDDTPAIDVSSARQAQRCAAVPPPPLLGAEGIVPGLDLEQNIHQPILDIQAELFRHPQQQAQK